MTTQEQLDELKKAFEEFTAEYYKDRFSDLQVYNKQFKLGDGVNLEVGSTTGCKIGTSTAQKLGFFNQTPVDKPDTVSDANNQGAGYVQADVQSITDAVNDLISRLKELGLIA